MDEAIRRGKPMWEVLPHAGQAGRPFGDGRAGRRAVSHDDRAVPPQMKRQSPVEVVKTLIRDIAYKDELDAAVSRRRRSGGPLGVGRGSRQRRGRLRAAGVAADARRLSAGGGADGQRGRRGQGVEAGTERRGADDAPRGQGAGVSRGLHGRHGRRHAAASPDDRRRRARRSTRNAACATSASPGRSAA